MITNWFQPDILRRRVGSALLITGLGLMLAACTGDGGRDAAAAGRTAALEPEREPWDQPVPKAQCGSDDRTETALQGQVPLTDRGTGRSLEGYTCNLERVGHHQGVGTGWQMAWFEDCAYYGTASHYGLDSSTPMRPRENPGVVTLDVADPTDPRVTAYLDSVSMLDPWESLKVSEGRQLLAGINSQAGGGGPEIDVYDISGDCTQPELLFSGTPQGNTATGHAGNFSADGLTYYGGDLGAGIVYPIDVSDPAEPELIGLFNLQTHDLSTNADGTRVYLANNNGNGLTIVDSTEVQQRLPEPSMPILTEFYWEDGALAQMTQPIKIGGHPYLLFVDEGASGITKWDFCANDLPPFAFARIIDIADEENPRIVSKMKLETHDPANCAQTIFDDAGAIFLYDSHYCTVDDPEDARLLACSYFESGLRVFDIRDPYRPREIAYYNAPLTPGYYEGSYYQTTGTCNTADWAGAHPRFVLQRDEIWYTGQCTGFHVLRFTRPLEELLGPPPAG